MLLNCICANAPINRHRKRLKLVCHQTGFLLVAFSGDGDNPSREQITPIFEKI
jgi:hypothetical protein